MKRAITPCLAKQRADYAGMQRSLIPKAEAQAMVRKSLIPLLEAGHELTVQPGLRLRKMKVGSAPRYCLFSDQP